MRTPRGEAAALFGLLILLGAGWGITQPLTKIAVSTGHGHFGLIFWQLVIGASLMTMIALATGRRLPMGRSALRVYGVIALIGTVLPNTASYQAAVHLPSGVLSILLSLIPMIAFPIALGLGLERFSLRRLAGLALGLVGVALLVLPEASLPDAAMVAWVPIAIIASLCYAFEGNYVARWGTAGLDPVQVLLGASVAGAVMTLPLMLVSGHWISPFAPYGRTEWALIASSTVHVMVYTAFVWLIGRAGSVFAVQVSYLVTGFGVIWAMFLLGERYAPMIWAAMGLMMVGMALVQPRPKAVLAPLPGIGQGEKQ
ncbi:MAG: DMT family transporter [Paracoccaceae bacterium]|jgi:drug/metabolite transporter (DMT)-like permease|nr:DMT family transporter [Paracoccaceae bacterium]